MWSTCRNKERLERELIVKRGYSKYVSRECANEEKKDRGPVHLKIYRGFNATDLVALGRNPGGAGERIQMKQTSLKSKHKVESSDFKDFSGYNPPKYFV